MSTVTPNFAGQPIHYHHFFVCICMEISTHGKKGALHTLLSPTDIRLDSTKSEFQLCMSHFVQHFFAQADLRFIQS